MHRPNGHLYFHAPCFDGIVSAVLTWEFMKTRQGWKTIHLHPVNYDIRHQWLERGLRHPAAVVDFLYHPEADFWADHHLTTFLDESVETDFKSRAHSQYFYDSRAGSCAEVIWHHLKIRFGHRNERYRSLVRWAAKLDAAKYRSAKEAVFASSAALRIARTLALHDDRRYSAFLVRRLLTQSLDEVACLPAVRERYEQAKLLLDRGLAHLRESLHVDSDGIVTFDVDASDAVVNRYAPYLFAPTAPYIVGILRNGDATKVTAMRNPWSKSGSIALGALLERFGGGGHPAVGSVLLTGDRAREAPDIQRAVVEELRRDSRRDVSPYDRAV